MTLLLKIIKKINKIADNYSGALLLKNIKPVNIQHSDNIIIFNQVYSNFAEKLYTLASHELSTNGIPNFFLYKDESLRPHYARLDIDGYEISNSLIVNKKRRLLKSENSNSLFFKWTVDIQNEKIAAEGINFFPIIRNTLRKLQKRYNVSFSDENGKPVYEDLIQSCDLLLKYFILLKGYSKTAQKKIRLVGWEINLIPNGVLRILCDKLSHNRDIEFVQLQRGYINLFGKHHFRESYVSCSNLTKTKLSDGWSLSKEEFAADSTENIELQELLEPISNVIEKRIYSETPESQKEIINLIKDYRSRSKKVFVLFSHLFYDTPAYDESPAFNGMCEWIKETIKYFTESEDLLLIKPHPSEIRKDLPKKNPNETLVSFLADTTLSKNVLILEPRLFTVGDLAPFISCALIWRSSVAMELVFLGVPCVIAGSPYYNILDLSFATNKQHYFYMIKHSHEIEITDKQKTDVARYLYLLKRKHIHVDCIEYNKKLEKLYWNRKVLKKYLRNGDEKIRLVVENILV